MFADDSAIFAETDVEASVDYASTSKRHREALVRNRDPATDGKIPFYLPFISDDVSTAIRQCLRRSALNNVVSVVEIPPSNLKRQLVRYRMYDRFCITPNCIDCPQAEEATACVQE
ncbi:hypothetical protein Y032_0037g3400 [Ancylostoma ceylanicum]|uniref:Uncharacterized protein n=1 Tax=Ancylostoma ceylanicum TaxID=53326 RepID=A0A016UJY7_9BILA|nr:hypothetical protein Y032_0037g3400 [Ancylostoma ceylanicum]